MTAKNMKLAEELSENMFSTSMAGFGDMGIAAIAEALDEAERRGMKRAINIAQGVREFINLDDSERDESLSVKYWASTRAISEVVKSIQRKMAGTKA